MTKILKVLLKIGKKTYNQIMKNGNNYLTFINFAKKFFDQLKIKNDLYVIIILYLNY